MKSVFDKATRDELITRISFLNERSAPLWGEMNVSQMIRHCAQWDEMALGKKKYKRSFIGMLFGKIALKSMLKDEPMKKNMPTVPSFKMTGRTDVETEKRKWVKLIGEYENYPGAGFIHPFFGAMKEEDTGIMAYKHMDHHLRQFGA